MYDPLPISGIRESHRFVEGPRTILLPLCILTLLAGLTVFYFNGSTAPSVTTGKEERMAPLPLAEDSSSAPVPGGEASALVTPTPISMSRSVQPR